MAIREPAEIKADIRELAAASDTLMLAHCYCDPAITGICDISGDDDRLLLSAADCRNSRIVVCGCGYIAEKIKLLRPELTVILVSPQSRCPVSGQVCVSRVESFREEHPDTYIVCATVFPAEIMALCDSCVTPRSMRSVISSVQNDEILLIADNALARNAAAEFPERKIISWSCRCPAFSGVTISDVTLARERWRGLPVMVNSLCSPEICELADFCGSSAEITERCDSIDGDVVMVDEISVAAQLSARYPERRFMQIADAKLICGNMKRCNPERLELALKGQFGTVIGLPSVSQSNREHIAAMLRQMVCVE